jgi:phage/plasmid-associated DNA primase
LILPGFPLKFFRTKDENVHLREQLLEHLDGIFRWSLEGLKHVLKRERIDTPEAVDKAKERFREYTNSTIIWAKERCVIGKNYSTPPPELWKDYKAWCEDSGLKKKGKRNFYEDVRLNFMVKTKRINTRDYWLGIGLKFDEDQETIF